MLACIIVNWLNSVVPCFLAFYCVVTWFKMAAQCFHVLYYMDTCFIHLFQYILVSYHLVIWFKRATHCLHVFYCFDTCFYAVLLFVPRRCLMKRCLYISLACTAWLYDLRQQRSFILVLLHLFIISLFCTV